MIYLDNSATTKPFDEVTQTVAQIMSQQYFNASATYGAAIKSDKIYQSCRETLARSLGCAPGEVFFTSGGTEGANAALRGALEAAHNKRHFIISATEHPCVYETAKYLSQLGYSLDIAPVLPNGEVDPDKLLQLVREDTALVSVIHVNNETGVINDIKAITDAVKAKNPGCVIHCDGVQAHFHITTNVKALGVDIYTTSGHKIHGPKGIGVIYIKKGLPFKPQMLGGGQQDDFRSGTIDLPAIAGYAKATELWRENGYQNKICQYKEKLWEGLAGIGDIEAIGQDYSKTAPHILNISFKGINAAVLQSALDKRGVIVGKGSACSSRNTKVSRVLTQMKVPTELAQGAIRFSIGALNEIDEIEPLIDILQEEVTRLRKFKRK